MTKILSAAALGMAVLCAAPTASLAQTANCAPRENVLEHLSEKFGEARQSIGMASGNRVVEMFASTETGTWTLTMTLPDGRTCIIGAGQSFERLDEAPVPTGQPT